MEVTSGGRISYQLIQVNVEEPPKIQRYISGHLALCTNCGLCSEDLYECVRCKFKFTPKSKIIVEQNNEQSTPTHDGQNSKIMKQNGVRKPKMSPSPRTTGGGRKAEDCIVLSSDDEDGPKSKVSKNAKSKKLIPGSDVSSSLTKSIRATGNKVKINLTSPQPQLYPPSHCSQSLKVNLKTLKSTTNENETEHEEVVRSIESAVSSHSLHGAYATVECRSVRIGAYRCVESHNVNYNVVFSTKGILFSVPHAQRKQHIVKCGIPHGAIIGMTAHLTKRLPVVILATGPKYAVWIRKQLGLGDKSSAGNYYCPANGGKFQQRILFFATQFSDINVASMRQIYGSLLEEVDYCRINIILMEITPLAHNSTLTSSSTSNQSNVISSTSNTSDNPPLSATSSSSTKIVVTDNHSLKPCESSQDQEQTEVSQVDVTDNKTLLSYKGIAILQQDILCLAEEQYLNDSILDFWLRYVEHEILQPVDKERTYMFSTFFYKRLTTKQRKRGETYEDDPNLSNAEKRHNRVKRWTKNVDIFEKDFILVPINEYCHWLLAVICYPGLQGVHDLETGKPIPDYAAKRNKLGKVKCKNVNPENVGFADSCDTNCELRGQEAPAGENVPLSEVNPSDTKPVVTQRIKQPCILILDSLAGESRNRIYSTLREYLGMEYKSQKGEERDFTKATMPGGMPKVVQQPNLCDCGIFTLFYVECFFKFPLLSFEFPIEGEMWKKIGTWDTKREQIYKCIQELVKRDNPEAVVSIPKLIFPIKQIKKERKKQMASVQKLVKVGPAEEPMDTLLFDSQLTSDSGICSQNSQNLVASPLKISIVEMTRANLTEHDHDYVRIPDLK